MKVESTLNFSEESIWFQSLDNPDDRGYLEKIIPIPHKPGYVDIVFRKPSVLNAFGFLKKMNLKTIPNCPAEFIEMIPAGLCGNQRPMYILLKGTNNSSRLLDYIQNDLSEKLKRIKEENEELKLREQLSKGLEKIRKLETEDEIKTIRRLLKREGAPERIRKSFFRGEEDEE